MIFRFLALGLLGLTLCACASSPERIQEKELEPSGFQSWRIALSGAPDVSFYLRPAAGSAARPLVVFCDGSGSQSVFTRTDEGLNLGLAHLLSRMIGDRAHFLVVEKPGVNFGATPREPGSSNEGSEEFLRHYTPDDWARSQIAAIEGASQLCAVDPKILLVMGFSEGGHTASAVAARHPGVTHVAIFSCGGPSQLFDLMALASRPRPDDGPDSARRRRDEVKAVWAGIQKKPGSITDFWLGHPYRRWSSFLSESVSENLLASKAKVFAAHGALDEAVPVESHDMLVAALLAKGKQVESHRVAGVGHSFAPPNTDDYRALDRVLETARDWALGRP